MPSVTRSTLSRFNIVNQPLSTGVTLGHRRIVGQHLGKQIGPLLDLILDIGRPLRAQIVIGPRDANARGRIGIDARRRPGKIAILPDEA